MMEFFCKTCRRYKRSEFLGKKENGRSVCRFCLEARKRAKNVREH